MLVVVYPNHIDMNGKLCPYDRNEVGFNPKLFYVPIKKDTENNITFWYSEYDSGIFPVYTHISILRSDGTKNVILDKSEYAVFPIRYISKLKHSLLRARTRLRERYYNCLYNETNISNDLCKYVTSFII